MGVRIVRPERKIYHIPGLGIQTIEALASGAAWWKVAGKTCAAAYQPKGAASYAASKINLANPGTYDATEGTAPSWDAGNGWKFDHTNSEYLNTGVVPNNDWTMIAQFSDHIAGIGDYRLCGQNSSTNQPHFMGPNYWGTKRFVNGLHLDAGAGALSGNIALAGMNGYFNGASVGTITGAGFTGVGRTIWIGSGNPTASFTTVYIQAWAVYSGTLSAAEIAVLAAAMAAL